MGKKYKTEEERKEARRVYMKKYRQENKEKISQQKKEYREGNKEKLKEYKKKYRQENKEKIKEWEEKNKEKRKEYKKKYRQENKEKLKEYQKKYKTETDKLYRVKYKIRSLVSKGIKKVNTNGNTDGEKILGCSFKELREYIESQWEDWMTWDNYGLYNGCGGYGWDIDHIKPLSLCESEEDVYKLNHYTNLQPLCSYINRNVKDR